ncbi:MAG: hypothetical protein RR555_07620 [Bacteroidales bacterium]
MYKLDSGWISIIATIAAIIAAVYSGKEKQRKERAAKGARGGEESDDTGVADVAGEMGVSDATDAEGGVFNNPFEELFGFKSEVRGSVKSAAAVQEEEEDDDMFSFLRERPVERSEAEPTALIKEVPVAVVEQRSVPMAEQVIYNNEMDSIENTTAFYNKSIEEPTAFEEMIDAAVDVIENEEIGSRNENMVQKSSGRDFRGRLKLHPKDIILFSEILKPKYQDF